MSSKKKKRRKKLKQLMKKRGLKGVPSVVICVGKSCCDREVSRELVHVARTYAEAEHPLVHIGRAGCLHVCKKGPIAATYPDIEIHKRVSAGEVRALVDEVAAGVEKRHT